MSTSHNFDPSYFDQAYGDYDRSTPDRKVRAYADFVRRFVPTGRLLEVGCAYGMFASAFARDHEVIATDLSSEVIASARKRFGHSHLEFRAGDVRSLDLPRDDFDAVVALDVLEHLPDLDDYLTHLITLLRPGGFLFVSVPVYDGPLGPLVRLLDRDPTHIHKWPRHAWRARLGRAPLRVVDELGMIRYPLGPLYLFTSGRRLARISPALLFACQRKDPRGNAPTRRNL